ncbi:MAG: sulfite exporter TauE/SafE family protein [Saprospiraceae bacterium]
MTTTLIIIFIASFLAFSISAICGGGAGLMLLPILGRMLPIVQVPAALSIGTFTSSASRLVIFRKSVCWHIVKYFVPTALPAVWLGAWLLKYLNPLYLELAMGLFLISNLTFLFKKPAEINSNEKPTKLTLSLIGFSAGFLSGLTGAVGLLFNRFYLSYGLSKEEIVATRAANEIILHLVKIVLYSLFGLITMKAVSIGIIVSVSAILSSWLMKWVLPKLSEIIFKKIGYFAMVITGFLMLSQSGSDLLLANSGNIDTDLIEKGLESKVKWQNANYALEFTYDEGFEFEQIIPITQLTVEQQKMIESKMQNADKIVVEVVHTIGSTYYEAYCYKANKLIIKIEFD